MISYLVGVCDLRTFHTVEPDQASRKLRVVLSCDDGCRAFVEYAILYRFGLRANHNIVAQSVETSRPPWIIAVMDALHAASLERIR
jgi:hypothetical protein